AERAMPARVIDQVTGRMFNVALEEDRAFWEWAIVETLRHSGIRIEELSELTHLSIRQYQRPNGEVAALLVIAPSKTDREPVIPNAGAAVPLHPPAHRPPPAPAAGDPAPAAL